MGRDTPNAIARAEATARDRGVRLRPLNDSNPTRHGLGPSELPGVYEADPRGSLAARRELARFLTDSGRGGEGVVDPDHLYLLDSTSEAYAWLFMLLCDPGDAVLAPVPGYPLVDSLARLVGVGVLDYRLRYDGSWTVDMADIRRILESPEGGRIRALVLINPDNPTGSYVHPEERAAVIDLCRRHGLALIADEVFFGYPLEPLRGRRRLAGEEAVLTFALDGLSKSLAAPHAKVGWIRVSGPEDQVAEALRLLDRIADDFLPVSACVAEDLPRLLAAVEGRTGAVLDRIGDNLRRLEAILASRPRCPVSLMRPEGGWSVVLRIPSVIDEDSLVLRLISQKAMTDQPGYFFDMPGSGYLVLSLLPEPTDFVEGATAVLDLVDAMLEGR
ncbi:pyridoxal phosphate-dependent aminotransferase [uncultured Bifidobacterium sp.]|uniref:pyridoxal phosphate-dependent aminotransferase n=1 Tax=uncultured Bifidobacterium sp. TaxID=165187 RepID=UPI0028DC1B54|nr:pyridoxal phosphate-dependent aminotransferase [uncultured Bifidobacterium sp.]